MSAEHEHTTTPVRNIDDMKTLLVAVVGVVTVILVLVIMICTQAWFYKQDEARNAEVSFGERPADTQAYLDEQHAHLANLQYVDQGKTRVKIPLDRAMEIYAAKGQ
ncbi:MAG: hypothetical protein GC162_04425 [Planctomycetes bacterium]|nr:hypothetical protein [Planctomycetota bacterium]